MRKPEISRMLTISTGHISLKTRQLLESATDDASMMFWEDEIDLLTCGLEEDALLTCGLAVYRKDHVGFYVYLPPAGIDRDFSGVPQDLLCVLQYCEALDCEILCLDSDGQKVPFLPWY